MNKTNKLFWMLIIVLTTFLTSIVFAGDVPTEVDTTLDEINTLLVLIAGFVCLAKLIHIGISYMLAGAGGKGQAKTAIWPWIIGTFVCTSYATFGKKIINEIRGDGSHGVLDPEATTVVVERLGPKVLGYFGLFATIAAFVVLIVIAMKYLTSGAAGRAQAKNTFLPWLIGLLIAASATTIMQFVIDAAPTGEDFEKTYFKVSAGSGGNTITNNGTLELKSGDPITLDCKPGDSKTKIVNVEYSWNGGAYTKISNGSSIPTGGKTAGDYTLNVKVVGTDQNNDTVKATYTYNVKVGN